MPAPVSRARATRLAASLLLCLLPCVLPTLGCSSTPTGTTTRDAPVRAEVARAESLLWAGDARAARDAFDPIVRKVPAIVDRQLAARVMAGRAEAALRMKDLVAARGDVARAEQLNGARATDAREQRRLKGRIAFLRGEVALASRSAAEAATHYQAALAAGSENADTVHHRLYLCNRLLGRSADAASWRAKIRDPLRPDFAALEEDLLPAPAPARPAPRAAVAATSAPTDPGAPEILARARWSAKPIRSDKSAMSRIRRITVHHSATPFSTTDYGQTAAHLRSIQNTHQNDRRWADIGYHYLIDRAGRVWEGRELKWQGAHAGNADLNDGNVGICVLGDYERAGMSKTQEASLYRMLDWLRGKYGVAQSGIYTHREIRGGTSECPGPHIAKSVARYRSAGSRLAAAP